MRESWRRSRAYSGVSTRPAATTAWCASPSTSSAPVRAMFSRSEPKDRRSHCSWARYWRNPLTKTTIAVRSKKLAPRRQASRRQIGRVAFNGVRVSGYVSAADCQLGDVPLEEQLDRPVEHDTQARRERRQLKHVDGLPQEPSRKAREPESAEVRDGRPAAQRHHLAEQAEVERRSRSSGQL